MDDAVSICQKLGRGTLLAKIDLKNAFRQCPVRTEDWRYLGIYWREQFYIDKCLPFGLRSAPYLFNLVAQALAWIIKDQAHTPHVIHYLDDFLLAGSPQSEECTRLKDTTMALCSELGVVVKEEKTVGPTTTLTFLGIELDTIAQIARLPDGKLTELLLELRHFCRRKSCTKRELLSVIGKLVFASKVIPAGRIFTRRLIDASMTVARYHHCIHLNREIRADLQWWLDFTSEWNSQSFFLQDHWTLSPRFHLFTDASGTLGYGAYWDGQWLRGNWQQHQNGRTIEWKELFAVVIAAMAWGHAWGGGESS